MTLIANWEMAMGGRNNRSPAQRSGVKLVNYMMKDGRRQACLTVYEDTMKRMRWGIGDRVIYVPGEYDGKPCIAMRRVPSGGKKISPASSAKGLSEKLEGKAVAGAIRWATEVFADYADTAKVDRDLIEVDGALIMLVKRGASRNWLTAASVTPCDHQHRQAVAPRVG
jgi:hypothetical protein